MHSTQERTPSNHGLVLQHAHDPSDPAAGQAALHTGTRGVIISQDPSLAWKWSDAAHRCRRSDFLRMSVEVDHGTKRLGAKHWWIENRNTEIDICRDKATSQLGRDGAEVGGGGCAKWSPESCQRHETTRCCAQR